MSLKYQRVKQADLLLPAPLRWLTRAFSSVTLAIILLSMVMAYGLLSSVPIAMLVRGLGYLGIVVLALALPLGLVLALPRRRWLGLAGVLPALALAVWLCQVFAGWAVSRPFFELHKATVLYRLPAIEMTELEFYSWWPLKVILGLFVLNLIWATLRRIEFKFVNIGVLTVHTGIVTLATGSLLYGYFKVEGDLLLWRKDLGGTPQSTFYDGTRPALYLTVQGRQLMMPLPGLPRYNDRLPGDAPGPGSLAIRLDEDPIFREIFGPRVHAEIPGFIAYGELVQDWVDAAANNPELAQRPFPALRIAAGSENQAGTDFSQVLLAGIPAQRLFEQPSFAIEYLHDPPAQRLTDLQESFAGEHGLIVEIPGKSFRAVYAISAGQTIALGDTGCKLTIEAVGPYGMAFATPGYQGASDSRAMVLVEDGQRKFRRLVMHRYPERSQDFLPPPPGQAPAEGMGPMGQRVDPDPAIHLVYLDAGKLQLHLISRGSDLSQVSLLARIPGQQPILGALPSSKFPLGAVQGQAIWMHLTQRMLHAQSVDKGVPTPKAKRKPKDEGTFVNALVPVDFWVDPPPAIDGAVQPQPVRQRIWLAHMRYPMFPDDVHRPQNVRLPGVGNVQVAFSRWRHPLPFSVSLEEFAMQPYPGSTIPRDFVAQLGIGPAAPSGTLSSPSPGAVPGFIGEARLNNPLLYHGYKLSQTGWDPGEASDPLREQRDAAGRFTHQQRYSIIGVGNNVGIRVIFIGACLIVLGIPWAFYIKPLLVQRQKRKIQEQLRAQAAQPADLESAAPGTVEVSS